MKKILFLSGPSQDPSDRFFAWPTSLLYAIAPTIKAINDGYLELEVAGQILGPWSYVEGVNADEVMTKFESRMQGVDILCASTIYDALYPTLQLFAKAKSLNPQVITILGGAHFDETHKLQEINGIVDNPLVDYGIAGDGEVALMELLWAIADRGSVDLADVASRSTGRAWLYGKGRQVAVVNTPLVLDSLPFMPIEMAPDHHRQDFDIFSVSGQILPAVQMMAARGCPYSCSCCSERRDLAYPNVRSVGNIIEEIELRKQQGFKVIFFDDSTFGAYPKLRELLQELAKTGVIFGSLNRFNHMADPKLVELYRQAGFAYVYCSIEQFDDATLKGMSKGMTTNQIVRGLETLSQNGIKVGVSLLYGFPYETKQSIRTTLDFTKEWVDRGVIKLVSESALSFHPGTPEGRNQKLSFNQTPPHIGFPWNRFEEGQWYHPEHVTAAYLEEIAAMSEERFSRALVRNRHSWLNCKTRR
jgi:radical SAM superfamily enzyme YgiQ (UPF0313 family)